MILNYFIFIFLALRTQGERIHEHMTKEEIESTFNINHTSIDEVEYDVAPLLHVHELASEASINRKPRSVFHFRAFEKDISLYLLENDNRFLGSKTPIYMAERTSGNEIRYTKTYFPELYNLKLYHDIENQAAITVFTDGDNKSHVLGTIGNEYIIKPIPTRLRKEMLSNELPENFLINLCRAIDVSNPVFRQFAEFDPNLKKCYDPYIIIKTKSVNPSYYAPTGGRFSNLNPYQPLRSRFPSPRVPTRQPPAYNRPAFRTRFPDPWPAITQPPTYDRPAFRTRFPDPWPAITQPPIYDRPDFQTRFPVSRPPIRQPPTYYRPAFTTRFRDPLTSTTQPPYYYRPTTSRIVDKPSKPTTKGSGIVYPKLLIAVDYDIYEFHGNNIHELSKYMAAFWNAVDLRFRELSQPEVRLNIAGLIVPQTRDSAPYFEDALRFDGVIYADGPRGAAEGTGRYLASQFPQTMYDIAVGMTRRDLYSVEDRITINGIANAGTACLLDKSNAYALIKDEGGFKMVTTAAHELGHSFNADHDKAYDGGFSCPESDGFLETYSRHGRNGVHWSRCSKKAIKDYLSSNPDCMSEPPFIGKPYPKILPGKILRRDEQCSRILGNGHTSFEEKESDCENLHCQNITHTIKTPRPPAEGSSCGPRAICLDAECVLDPTI